MEFSIKINWFGEVLEKHENDLKEAAINRAFEMLNDGYSAGELLQELDDVYYKGWWNIQQ